MKKKLLAGLFVCFLALGLFLNFVPVRADMGDTGPYIGLEYGRATGLGTEDIRFTIAQIIRVALGLLGTIALVLVIYAGFSWMTAGGNEEKVTTAKSTLMAATIGLAIILSAYAITAFVTTQLFKATTGNNYSTVEFYN